MVGEALPEGGAILEMEKRLLVFHVDNLRDEMAMSGLQKETSQNYLRSVNLPRKKLE